MFRALALVSILAITAAVGADNPCYPNRACFCDFDDGSGTGTPDGACSSDDLWYYLSIYADGSICADVDDGSGTGTQDGAVTLEDLLYLINRSAWYTGC